VTAVGGAGSWALVANGFFGLVGARFFLSFVGRVCFMTFDPQSTPLERRGCVQTSNRNSALPSM
jgi:hypothetical protein